MGLALQQFSPAHSAPHAFDALLHDEPGRLSALQAYEVLDTEPEAPFDNVVALIRSILGVAMATVTLVDEHRQWFKARAGVPDQQTPRVQSICTYTILDRAPLLIDDVRNDGRFAELPSVTGGVGIRSYAGIPLTTPEGYNIGAVCALDTRPRSFTAAEVGILQNLAGIVMTELELRRLAQSDQLTGAQTRRGFIDRTEAELARARRYGASSSLLLLDVDHFKAINDGHGHPAGDAVLRALADRVRGALRPCDTLGRIGGEEFALLLPDTDGPGALALAERVRETIARTPIALPSGQALAITASFGVAALGPGITSAEAWIAAADVPLYRAKRTGRNRCLSA